MSTPEHPGKYVKETLIPEGLSVKKSAEMMGIGRPALSNFLNGKANLSRNMASRLAKTFGADKEKLLHLQQEFERHLALKTESRIVVKSYAPSFLAIRASQIDEWSNTLDARSRLPAFLRCLINSSGADLLAVDFPAYDHSQRHGWDGQVESSTATPWIPVGNSGWEFGCNQDVDIKAEGDYSARTKSIGAKERKSTTFVFVSPRNWKKKEKWVIEKKAKKEWADVRAYDANDLEQWLETSVTAQVWLAELLGINTNGCQTMSNYWRYWSNTAAPPISKKIFNDAVSSHKDIIKKWFKNRPTDPLVITAASKEEALAFLSSISEDLAFLNDHCAIVDNSDIAKRLSVISKNFVPVAYNKEVEEEIIRSYTDRPSIVISENNIKSITPDITIDLPGRESFRTALKEMGFNDAEIDLRANESSNSPTILRRLLAKTPYHKNPAWALENENLRKMVPLVLAGTWKSDQKADQEILSILTRKQYSETEKDIAFLADIDDAPIWSEGKYRGVISKLESFFSVASLITFDDLDNFFLVAEYALSEDDPSLDLDEDKRWMANIYEKVREHSNAIRESLCETLIIFSVYGNPFFGDRLGENIEVRVALLVRQLLANKEERIWLAQQNDFPRYAEAAPDEFLDIVEAEVRKGNPAFGSLFHSSRSAGMFLRCDRTGMLWALELLAWSPGRLTRVIKILAKLCEYPLDDNWVNKPINSVSDILLSWLPHTAADINQRKKTLEILCKSYPKIGWQICMREMKPGLDSTSDTYRPKWRSDASGAGHGVSWNEKFEYQKRCQEIVMSWEEHDIQTLSDLIDCMENMDQTNIEIIADEVSDWLNKKPNVSEILKLREHVRTSTMTQKARHRNKRKGGYADGRKIYELLKPESAILKNQWLFQQQWIEYTPEELDIENLDFDERDKRVAQERVGALIEVINEAGYEGIITLCISGEAGGNIGFHLARDICNYGEVKEIMIELLQHPKGAHRARLNSCIFGIISFSDIKTRQNLIGDIVDTGVNETSVDDLTLRLLLNSPTERDILDIVEHQKQHVIDKYWQEITPSWRDYSENDMEYLVMNLLQANRPMAAFRMSYLKPDKVDSKLLVDMLQAMASSTKEHDQGYRFQCHEIERVLESLNKRGDVNQSDLAQLEFLYIQVLSYSSKYGIPNLSKDIANSPILFMQLVAIVFKRDDDAIDPVEWNLPTNSDERRIMATRAYEALECVSTIPGTDKKGKIDPKELRDWVNCVRKMAIENGRVEITDQRIGKILSTSDIDTDEIWPRKEVRQVLEELSSPHISTGMEIGAINSDNRKEHWGADGKGEHSMYEKYKGFSVAITEEFPFVAKMLSNIAASYGYHARWNEEDNRVRRRLDG
jgi:addiction module HigA family antidote